MVARKRSARRAWIVVLSGALVVLAIFRLVAGIRRRPDWEFRVEDGAPVALTVQQRVLLAELEHALSSLGPEPSDEAQAVSVLRPLVLALDRSGLSAQRIANHSRIRLESVALLLNRPVRAYGAGD